MEPVDLSMQLGITSEDAAFLQQVLNETDLANSESNAATDEHVNPVSTDHIIEQANQNPILHMSVVSDNDSTSRFSSAIWYEKVQQQTIILAGLGGIGSYTAYLLSRMRPSCMFVYDDDIVETGNLSGQMFRRSDVGISKANAIGNIVRSFSDYTDMFTIADRFTEYSQAANIMICGFDNMESRKIFFRKWYNHVMSFDDVAERAKCLFIDGRLAAENFQVLCIKGDDSYSIQKYMDNWLFDDDEAEETICSYKQTTFCANMIASVMVNCFVNFIANQCDPLIPRDVPFLTEYDASMMLFKTES